MVATGHDSSRQQLIEAALAYDRWFDTRWGWYASEIEWRALERNLGQLRAARVLDVGCGTGRFTQRLEAAGAEVVGVDLDAAMLEVARSRVRGKLLRADAGRLPIRGRSL